MLIDKNFNKITVQDSSYRAICRDVTNYRKRSLRVVVVAELTLRLTSEQTLQSSSARHYTKMSLPVLTLNLLKIRNLNVALRCHDYVSLIVFSIIF